MKEPQICLTIFSSFLNIALNLQLFDIFFQARWGDLYLT